MEATIASAIENVTALIQGHNLPSSTPRYSTETPDLERTRDLNPAQSRPISPVVEGVSSNMGRAQKCLASKVGHMRKAGMEDFDPQKLESLSWSTWKQRFEQLATMAEIDRGDWG